MKPFNLFSKPSTSARDMYQYDLSQKVRSRIIHTVRQRLDDDPTLSRQGFGFKHTLEEVGKEILKKQGSMEAPSQRSLSEAMIHHFFNCGNEDALECIKLLFRVRPHYITQQYVDDINSIFQEEGIGYELTPMQSIDTGETGNLFGRPAGRRIEYVFPEIIRKNTAKGGVASPAPISSSISGTTSTASPSCATRTADKPTVRTILVLAANPKDSNRLRLDEQVKRIEQGLERSKNRDQFKLVTKWAVTDDDLRRAMLDNEPEIVHFAGHGSAASKDGSERDLIPLGTDDEGGLAFEDESGRAHLIPGNALARLFTLCANHVKCVVLNACYSEVQADAISEHIDYVVVMRKAIGDEAAIKFAVGFYDALGAGRDFETAFKFGQSAIDLKGIPEYLTPVLKKKRFISGTAPAPLSSAIPSFPPSAGLPSPHSGVQSSSDPGSGTFPAPGSHPGNLVSTAGTTSPTSAATNVHTQQQPAQQRTIESEASFPLTDKAISTTASHVDTRPYIIKEIHALFDRRAAWTADEIVQALSSKPECTDYAVRQAIQELDFDQIIRRSYNPLVYVRNLLYKEKQSTPD